MRIRPFALAALFAGALALATFVVIRAQSAQTAAAPKPAAPPVVAEVNGEPITADEVERGLGLELEKLEQQIYEMKRQQVEQLIAQRLLEREAKRRNVSVENLVGQEVTAKAKPVTAEDVDRFYAAAKDRIPPNQPDIKAQIRTFLESQNQGQRRQEFVSALRADARVTVRLEPPPVTRQAVSIDGAPVRGEAAAPITLVEFSDFHCPFCRRVKPTLARLLEQYAGKIRLVYKDLPLDSLHPQARRAAEAGRCAGEQGKFWEYHDLLIDRGNDASDGTLTAVAAQAGLDGPAFNACLASGKFREAIQRDVAEAERLGISGTPAFFINGRALSGAQPFETFARIIDEELSGTVRTR